MKALLGYNHPTYLRRMARELNNRPAGFYNAGERWSHADFRYGVLRIHRITSWKTDRPEYATLSFANVEHEAFDDGSGGTICASRQAGRSS